MNVKQIRILSAAVAIAAVSSTTCSFADTYTIDPVHSTAIFKVKHMGTSNVYGRFNDVSGTVNLDDKDAAKSSIEVTIKADSVDTNNEKRNEHLKSPDFLNAKQFPTLSFKSSKVTKAGDNKFDVEGELDLHGVKKPVKATAEKVGSGKDMKGKDLIGGEAHFTIKRSDFDIKTMMNGISDDIEITISVEAGKQ